MEKENIGQGGSREIKFRAWDDTWTHKMMYSDDTNLSAFFSRAGQTEYNKNIMQYTGLKDKNGVDIYEFDIINVYTSEGNFVGIYEVVFWNGSFCVPGGGTHNLIKSEVIGNIYENKDLLSEK